MYKGIEIQDTPEAIKQLLTRFKTDANLAKTFEGTAKDGKLSGLYTNVAPISGMGIGLVKIVGVYHIEGGWIRLKAIPNSIFWMVIGIFGLAIVLILLRGIIYDSYFEVVGALCFIFMSGIFTLLFLLERRSFHDEIDRVHNH